MRRVGGGELGLLVFEALNNAVANGYGEWIRSAPVMEIACDLLDCDFALAEATDEPELLIPHIHKWLNED